MLKLALFKPIGNRVTVIIKYYFFYLSSLVVIFRALNLKEFILYLASIVAKKKHIEFRANQINNNNVRR